MTRSERATVVIFLLTGVMMTALIAAAILAWVTRDMAFPKTPEVSVTIGFVEVVPPSTVEEEVEQAITVMSDVTGIAPELIWGIISVENPMLDPDVENWYGAIGIMQVVGRLHLGTFPECGDDLTDVFTNVCYGVSLFEYKLQLADGDVHRALLYYNGCWGDTYQPGCETYPIRAMEGL